MKKLSDAAAEALSKHKGGLYLHGLTSLSDAAAESFSKHDGVLSLNHQYEESGSRLGPELSDAAVKSLSKHNGKVNGQDPKEWNWRYDKNGDNRPKGIFGYWK